MRDFSGFPASEIFTLHDLVHRMTLRCSGNSSATNQALYARAIQDAIRIMPSKHDWTYYRRQTRFTTSPAVDLTISYDHTGGSSERLVTITSDDVWPADATYGELLVGDKHYRILERLSDTTATLEEDMSLTEDFTGEASWERSSYLLSREVTKVHYVQNITRNQQVTYLPNVDFHPSYYTNWGRGASSRFTWQNHGNHFGRSELILLPAMAEAEVFEVHATVNPHIPKINVQGGADASVTSGSTTVTTSNGVFNSKLVGTIFRLGRNNNPPTDFSSDDWEFQAFVTAVPSATTLTLSEPATLTASGRGYTLSSPIDIDTSTMLECVEDEAYAQYTKNHDHKTLQAARQVAADSCRLAIARDNRVSLNSRIWTHAGVTPWELGGLYVISQEE